MLIVLAVFLVGMLVHPRYVILGAGPAVDTLGSGEKGPLVRVDGATTYPTTGSLDFTTVAQYGGPGLEITLWDLLAARLDPEAEVRPYDEVFPPDVTREEVKEQTSAQMSGSQHDAVAVALRALGKQETAVVAQVVPDGPARTTLRAGDVVLAVAEQPITSAPQVSARIQAAPAGPVPMRVRRGGRVLDIVVPTTTVQGRRLVGVGLRADFANAPEVTIDAGDVGGPSAGMMFSLAVYDKLTPGALTGGRQIAGTGTIGLDGSVGAIGGIRHKMVGAADDEAAWFLAPAANCREVKGHVPDGLRVVRVATFDEARTAVGRIGAGQHHALPTC